MPNDFASRLNGNFVGILKWDDLTALWTQVRSNPDGWYASLIGEEPPPAPMSTDALARFITEVDTLLRREHDFNYCGIVYADDRQTPGLIKIYDPHNLGSACGHSGAKIEPRWVLSRIQPTRMVDDAPLPGNRRHWWQSLFGGHQ